MLPSDLRRFLRRLKFVAFNISLETNIFFHSPTGTAGIIPCDTTESRHFCRIGFFGNRGSPHLFSPRPGYGLRTLPTHLRSLPTKHAVLGRISYHGCPRLASVSWLRRACTYASKGPSFPEYRFPTGLPTVLSLHGPGTRTSSLQTLVLAALHFI